MPAPWLLEAHMLGIAATAACGRNCALEAMPWDALLCARGWVGTDYGC